MRNIVFPLFAVSSAAIVYVLQHEGDILLSFAFSFLLETGYTLQVLIEKNKADASKWNAILLSSIVFGFIGVLIVKKYGKKNFYKAKRAYLWLFILTIIVAIIFGLLLTPLGFTRNSTTAWYKIGTLEIQATELFKPLYVLFHATLWRSGLPNNKRYIISTGVTLLYAFFLFYISELGTLMAIMMLWLILTFIFMERQLYFFVSTGGTAAFGIIIYYITKWGYAIDESKWGDTIENYSVLGKIYIKLDQRILMFTDYSQYCVKYGTDASTQPLAAHKMIIQGGLLGSTSNNIYIGEEHTDFAYVSLLYRCGIVFGIVVLFLFLIILFRGIVLSCNTDEKFMAIIYAGAALNIAVPTFINILGTTNMSVLAGVAIPFISHGGTNMAVSFFCIMLLLDGSCQRPNQFLRKLSYRFERNKRKIIRK